jgi:hypothetical protein
MSVSNEKARKLWNDVFGEKTEWAQDCFSTWIHRDDYGIYNKLRKRPGGDGQSYYYGWDVDHIRPISDFEKESDAEFGNNYEPMHRKNNQEKADNMPHFQIDSVEYKVVKCDICAFHKVKGYGIECIKTGDRVDWKMKKNKCYSS